MPLPPDMMKAWLHCGITVRGAWWKDNFSNWTFPVSDHWLLFLVQSGSLHLTLPGSRYCAEVDEAMLLPPGMLYRVRFGENSRILDLRFSVIPAIGSGIPFHMLPLPLVLPGPWDPALWDLPARMSRGKDSRWTSQHAAWQARRLTDDTLFLLINRAFDHQNIRHIKSPPAWLREAMQAAVHHIHDPEFNTSSFAKLAGCTPEHLTRSLQKTEGCSSSQYLRRLRIERAAHMIQQDPALSSQEVIERCGYRDPRQFRLQWKAETGTGIREFRRSQP